MRNLAVLDARGERAQSADGWREPSGRAKFFGWRNPSDRLMGTVAMDDIVGLFELPSGLFRMIIKSIVIKGDTYQHDIGMEDGFRLMKIMGWEQPK